LNVSSDRVPVGTPVDLTAKVTAYGQTPTGSISFLNGSDVLGTAPLQAGTATITVTLPRGSYTLTASYSGDSRTAPGTGSAGLNVTALVPTITSIDPATVPAGQKTTLTIHGTNFINGSAVLVNSFAASAPALVSSTEMRYDYPAFPYETDVQVDVWVSQPPPGVVSSAHFPLKVTALKKPPSPFTFTTDQATVSGITPGAMTSWAVVATGGNTIYDLNAIVTDSDHDGNVTLHFPFPATIPLYGTWTVADLSAHTIVAGNPNKSAPASSPFPAKLFLRDSNGDYSHIQMAHGAFDPWLFTWSRAGAGAWQLVLANGSALDEDGGSNDRIIFETFMMKPVGTSGPPPAGIAPGDMFVAVDDFGSAWWGDVVDSHLSESDGAGRIGFAAASSSLRETSGNADILLIRTEGTDGSVSARYTTADGTARAGKNYVARAGTVTFGPGEILKTISIPLIDNQVYSGTLQFKVNLSDPAGAELATTTTETVSILDDELPPTLALLPPSTSVQEGDAGQVDLPVTVRLTGATELPVTVSLNWSEGQFGPSHTVGLRFEPGETQKTFTVSYIANTTPEPDRTITVQIFNPANATIPAGSAAIKIIDNDFAGVSIADASVIESAGKVIVPLQLSRASLKPITVTYETRDGNALAGSDYVQTSGSLTLGPNATSISIPIIADSVHESIEAFTVVLTSVRGGKLDRAVAAVTIVDDDSPPGPRHRSAKH
jgi:hypothetical protein